MPRAVSLHILDSFHAFFCESDDLFSILIPITITFWYFFIYRHHQRMREYRREMAKESIKLELRKKERKKKLKKCGRWVPGMDDDDAVDDFVLLGDTACPCKKY